MEGVVRLRNGNVWVRVPLWLPIYDEETAQDPEQEDVSGLSCQEK